MNIQFTNFATTTLDTGITNIQTSITVAAGTGALFPSLSGTEFFYATLVDTATGLVREIVKVTARAADTLTVVRGQDGTTGKAFLAGDKVELRWNSAAVTDIFDFYQSGATVVNTVFSKCQERVSVKDFGAVGDGVADDTTAIQAAINAIGTATVSGQVYFPRGTYKTSATIDLGTFKGISLIGDGISASVIAPAAVVTTAIHFGTNLSTTYEQSVRDITIDCGGAAACTGMYFEKVQYAFVNNVEIKKADVSIVSDACVYHYITNSIMIGHKISGVKVISYSSCAINDCLFVNNAGGQPTSAGVWIAAAADYWVRGCNLVYQNDGMLIAPQGTDYAEGGFVSDCKFSGGNGSGVHIYPAATAAVKSLVLLNCSSVGNVYGVHFHAGGGVVDGVQLRTCRLFNNGYNGLLLNNSSAINVSMDGLEIAGNSAAVSGAYAGIKVGANINSFSLMNSRSGQSDGYSNSQKYGLEVAGGTSAHMLVTNNDFRNNVTAAILDGARGQNKIFRGNLGGAFGTVNDIWVSVDDYGAIGDGTTDDTAAIQAAINSGAKYIIATQGKTYRTTSALSISSSLLTLDFRRAELKLDDAGGSAHHINISGAGQIANIRLCNISFIRAQAATSASAVYSDNTGVIEVSGCVFYGNSSGTKYLYNGITISRGMLWYVHNNLFEYVSNRCINILGTGSGANRSVDVSIFDNRFDTCGTAVYTWSYTEGIFISRNVAYNFTSNILSFSSGTGSYTSQLSFLICDNDFDTSAGIGIYMNYVRNVQFNDNWISNCTGASLQVGGTTDSIMVVDNQLYPLAYGIQYGGQNGQVTGNKFSGGTSCIYFDATASQVVCNDNHCGNANYGINLSAGPANILVEGNLIYNMATGTISLPGSSSTISVFNNKGDGGVGASAYITVGSSPFTYTSGNRPECVSIYSGTVSGVTIGGNTYANATNAYVYLPPNTSCVVTYSALPIMLKVLQ